MKAMGSQQRVAELASKIRSLVEELALYASASGYIWMVIKKEGGNIGGCSANLKPYEAALADEAEKATERPVIVTLEGDPPTQLPKTERVLLALAKTRHVELHPIVAMMIQGLNEINNHKIPRVKALADPRTMPPWFPLSPDAYASRSQKMDLHQLFSVLDSIFNTIRGSVRSIRALHQMLDKAYKSGSCSIGTRAGMDSFFHFLEEEALGASGAAKADVIADITPAGTAPSYENYLRFGTAPSAFEEWGGLATRGGGESTSSGLPQMLPPPSGFLFPVREYANGGCMLPGMVGEEQRMSLLNDTPPLQNGGLLQALEMQYEAVANGGNVPVADLPVADVPVANEANEPVANVPVGNAENELVANGGNENDLVMDEPFLSEQTPAPEVAPPMEPSPEPLPEALPGTELPGVEGPEKVSEVVETFATQYVNGEFLWMVTSNEGQVGGCSPQLEPYAPAIMDQVDRAVQAPIAALPNSASDTIPKMSEVLQSSQGVPHSELWPFVAAMMTSLDGVGGQKAPKKRRKDPSQVQVPPWFPLPPEKYAARVQALSLEGLFCVLDGIFGHVRGQPPEIAKLQDGVEHFFAKNPLCLLELRAGIEGLLGNLESDAGAQGVPAGAQGVPEGAQGVSASGSGSGRKVVGRESAQRNPPTSELGMGGMPESSSVKLESLEVAGGGDEAMVGTANEQEQAPSSEKVTGSGRVSGGEESSGQSPVRSLGKVGKVAKGLAKGIGLEPVMGRSDSGKENIERLVVEGLVGVSDDGPKGDVQELKPLEGVTRVPSKKRTRRSESGASGMDGKGKTVYKPQAQKAQLPAYGRMLSLFEAAGLDTSAAGPVVG